MAPSSFHNRPSRNFAPITPSDSTPQHPDIVAVVCLTAGNLVTTSWSDVAVTFPLTAGQTLRISPKLVKASSTGTYAALR